MRRTNFFVIPAKAGIHCRAAKPALTMDHSAHS